MVKVMKIIKRLFCKIGWHSFPVGYDLVEGGDGYYDITKKYKCKWCGYVGMLDSQGNLF